MVNERIFANTDGLIVKLHGNEEEVRAICAEWEQRTGMGLGYDKVNKIIQADVNSYLAVFDNGEIEAKGGYVKNLNSLDNDLPIVNEAIRAYLLHGTPIETTIYGCNELLKFQKVFKLSGKYAFVMHNGKKYHDKCYRVFASKYSRDTYLGKSKGEGCTVEKFASCPDHCRIVNDAIKGVARPSWLDVDWYVSLTKKRLNDKFGVDL